MKFLLFFLIYAITLNTCNKNPSEKALQSILFVNSAKVNCTGVGEMTCLQIQETKPIPNKWENFYGKIEGFNYEPGYIYKLLVKKEKMDSATVPADASTIKYSLLKILEKTTDKKMGLHDIWALKAINTEKIILSENQKQPVLEIHLNEMKVLGNDGCNSMFGSIEAIDELTIKFGNLGGTEMACPNMELPSKYNAALTKTKKYKRDDLNLYFYDSEGIELLKYQKVD